MRLQVLLSKPRVLAIMVLLSAAMIVLGDRVSSYLRTGAQYAVAPAGEVTMFVLTGVKGSVGHGEHPLTREEADAYLLQVRELASNMELRHKQMLEVQEALKSFGGVRLANQFGPDPDAAVHLVPARVLARDSLPYGQSGVVRPGRQAGAQAGQAVVTTRQLVTDRLKAITESLPVFVPDRTERIARSVLVGKLGQTSAYTAQLILVTDPSVKTEGAIRRLASNSRSILVEGHERRLRASDEAIPVDPVGNGVEMVAQVAAEHKVLEGDLLVLPVERTYWPAEVLVGIVSRVDKSTTGFETLHIRPAADLGSLRDVYILVPQAVPAAPRRGGR